MPEWESLTATTVAALVRDQVRGSRTDVAIPLHDDLGLREVQVQVPGRLLDREHAAPTSRLSAALGPAKHDRLAGRDTRDGMTDVHGVRVHQPGHRLLVRVDVRRGDVLVRTNDRDQFGSEAAREVLDLVTRQLLRVDPHAAFRPTVWDSDDGTLPRHEHRQGLHFGQRDVLMVANAALGRSGVAVVLDAMAGEDLHASIVHLHREVHREFPLAVSEHLPHAVIQAHDVRGGVELGDRHIPQGPGFSPEFSEFRCHVCAHNHVEPSQVSTHASLRRRERKSRKPSDRSSYSSSSSPSNAARTSSGLARPPVRFIVSPIRRPIAAFLPLL